jgi:glycosyltransferase involved in cell wall biosynthesis
MRTVFINGKFLAQPVTGVQRFAGEVLAATDALLASGRWKAQCRLVLLAPAGRIRDLPRFQSIEIRELPSARLHAWEQIRLPWATRGAMLLNLAGSAPLLKLGQVCTFHDTAVFDVPEAYSALFVRWYRLLFSVQGRMSRRLLTVSKFSRERLCHHIKLEPRKIGVVHGAADHMRHLGEDPTVLERLGVRRGAYFLAVGSASPTKNFARLIEAFTGLHEPEARLIVVGGSNAAVFADTIDAARHDPRIIRAGRLSDEALKALFANARAYVFPSTYEGFGLPPIEAMLCGCPVIASSAASIPEICGAGASYFDPLSPESIRGCLQRALHDDAWLAGLSASGRRQAELFSWHHSATALLNELALLGLVTEQASGDASLSASRA